MVASTRSTGSPGNPATTTPKAPTAKTPLAAVVPTEPGFLMRVGMLVGLPTGGDSSGARRGSCATRRHCNPTASTSCAVIISRRHPRPERRPWCCYRTPTLKWPCQTHQPTTHRHTSLHVPAERKPRRAQVPAERQMTPAHHC